MGKELIDIPLQVYTSQYSYRGEDRLDTTVKTSDKLFAPTWDMVMRHKNGTLSDEEYREKYMSLMRRSFVNQREKWDDLLQKERVTFVCFCRKENFCHRLLLAEIFERLGAEYKGKI